MIIHIDRNYCFSSQSCALRSQIFKCQRASFFERVLHSPGTPTKNVSYICKDISKDIHSQNHLSGDYIKPLNIANPRLSSYDYIFRRLSTPLFMHFFCCKLFLRNSPLSSLLGLPLIS